MSHGAATGLEGEEAAEEDEEEGEEEEEGISPRRSFDAWCQATPLELVRARSCVEMFLRRLAACARVRAAVRIRGDATGGGESWAPAGKSAGAYGRKSEAEILGGRGGRGWGFGGVSEHSPARHC